MNIVGYFRARTDRRRNDAASAGVLALTTIACCGLLGCSSESSGTSTLVADEPSPPVHSLEVAPGDGSILISTNLGLYEIPRDASEARRIDAKLDTPRGTSPIGKAMTFTVDGPDRLLGSGHPDAETGVPLFLGLIASDDEGSNWSSVSRLGLADLHILRSTGDRVYGYDAVGGGMLVSDDRGKTWAERSTPPEIMVDFVVDPGNRTYLIGSGGEAIYRTDDASRNWRGLEQAQSAVFAWPARNALYRADGNGLVYNSSDRGESWQRVGAIDGEPVKLAAASNRNLLVVLPDATILESADGGRTWDARFTP